MPGNSQLIQASENHSTSFSFLGLSPSVCFVVTAFQEIEQRIPLDPSVINKERITPVTFLQCYHAFRANYGPSVSGVRDKPKGETFSCCFCVCVCARVRACVCAWCVCVCARTRAQPSIASVWQNRFREHGIAMFPDLFRVAPAF